LRAGTSERETESTSENRENDSQASSAVVAFDDEGSAMALLAGRATAVHTACASLLCWPLRPT